MVFGCFWCVLRSLLPGLLAWPICSISPGSHWQRLGAHLAFPVLVFQGSSHLVSLEPNASWWTFWARKLPSWLIFLERLQTTRFIWVFWRPFWEVSAERCGPLTTNHPFPSPLAWEMAGLKMSKEFLFSRKVLLRAIEFYRYFFQPAAGYSCGFVDLKRFQLPETKQATDMLRSAPLEVGGLAQWRSVVFGPVREPNLVELRSVWVGIFGFVMLCVVLHGKYQPKSKHFVELR